MLRRIIVVFFIFFISTNIFSANWNSSATWDSEKYIEKKLNTRNESNVAIAYSDKIPYPNIAITYGGITGLYYAYYDQNNKTWIENLVDSFSEAGYDLSLQIDNNGKPCISYMDLNKQRLKYAYYDTSWIIQIIDESPEVGRFSCLQLENGQNPHIAYYDSKEGALRYIYKTSVEWKKETIDIADNKMLGLYLSFKIDNLNNRHISYFDATADNLKYAYYNGSVWQIETVDSTGVAGLYTNLALDRNNKPHISYYGNGNLKYAYKNNDNIWNVEVIDSTFSSGMYRTRIFLDKENNKHIFYYLDQEDPNKLKYAKYSSINSTWEIKTIKTGIKPNTFDISVDINNELWFIYSYYYAIKYEIKYLGPNLNNWSYKKIDESKLVNYSFALDNQGNPNIVYATNPAYNTLKLFYNYYANDVWQKELIMAKFFSRVSTNNNDYIKGYPLIEIDKQNNISSAYFLRTKTSSDDSNSIKYLEKNGNNWTERVVKENVDKDGRFILSLDRNGKPYIGYYDFLSKIEIAYRDITEWRNYKPDSTAIFENYTRFSFDFDMGNILNLIYKKDKDLYYTNQKDKINDIWETPVKINTENLDLFNPGISFKISETNKKHLIYPKDYNNGIKYVSYENIWETEDVPGKIINNFGLQINSLNEPIFIGKENYTKNLFLYTRKNNVWEYELMLEDVPENPVILKLYNNQEAFIMNWDGLKYYYKIKMQLTIKNRTGNSIDFEVIQEDGPKGIKVTEYCWNFEGTQGIEQKTTEPIANFIYRAPGKYKARVMAVMENGSRITSFADVEIQ